MTRKARSQRNRSGQALVEYALTIALVAVGLTFAVLTLRNSVGNAYNSTSNTLGHASACSYGVACAGTANDGAGGGNEGGSGDGNGDGSGDGNGNNGGGNGSGNNGNGNGNGGSNGNGNTGNGNGNNGNGNGNGRGRKG